MLTIKPPPLCCLVQLPSRSRCTESKPKICGVGSSWRSFVSWMSATQILQPSKTTARSRRIADKESQLHSRVDGRYSVGLHGTAHRGNWMLQQIGAWKYRNCIARRFAHAVVEEHNMFRVRISCERRACSQGKRVFLGGLTSVLENAGHLMLLHKWGLVSRRLQEQPVRFGVG